jgi:hypothetical protein
MYRRIPVAALLVLLGLSTVASLPSSASGTQDSSGAPSQAVPQKPADPNLQPQASPVAERKKSKKVWTNDDLGADAGNAGSQAEDAKNTPTAKNAAVKPATPQEAAAFRKQLATLQAQLTSVAKQIAELKSFSKGETPGANGLQMHKAYTMEPVENQVQKLEDKRKSIAAQIDGVYDAARKRGIEPGQLR